MKKYNDRLQARKDLNTSNDQNNKIRIDLKIFRENEKAQINNYPFYYKKHRYN
jgi:hypothetical protein